MTGEQRLKGQEAKRILYEEKPKRPEKEPKRLEKEPKRLEKEPKRLEESKKPDQNNRVEVNHVAIAEAFDRRSKLSPEEYEFLTRELVQNLSLLRSVHGVGQIRDLLRRGANPNGLESSPNRTIRNTPIGRAANYPRCLAVLLEYEVDINVEMRASYPLGGQITALGIAAHDGNLQTVKMLLLAGANVNGPKHGISPIGAFLYTTNNRIKILSLLAAHGANVNETGGKWFTALQLVCSIPEPPMATYSVVEQLLSYGVNPNIRGGRHGSAIHAAVAALNFNTIQLLLQHGADPGLRAICTFTGRLDSTLHSLRRFSTYSLERHEKVTPLELLDKQRLTNSKDSRSRTLKIRTLLEGAISR